MLGPLPLYAWVAIAGGVLGYAGLYFWSISTPKELVGVDIRAGEAVTLVVTPPRDRVSVWGRYLLDTDDEDAEVHVLVEARAAGRLVAQRDGKRDGARVWHGGQDGWESFSDEATTIRGLTPGVPLELRITVRSTAPIRTARIFITR